MKESELGWMAWKPISTIMRTGIPTVRAGFDRDALAALFRIRAIDVALVVDDDGKPLGTVRRQALTEDCETAGEAMEPLAFTLNEAVPISLAASLMASARVDVVPVLSPTLDAVGLLSSVELMTWIARQAGHRVVDARTQTRARNEESVENQKQEETA